MCSACALMPRLTERLGSFPFTGLGDSSAHGAYPSPSQARRQNEPLAQANSCRASGQRLTVWMTACSKDLPDEPSAGTPQADVSILQIPANDDFATLSLSPRSASPIT